MPKQLPVMITIACGLGGVHLMPGSAVAQVQSMPPATATVTSERPTLEAYFVGAPIAFELCRDLQCTRVIDTWQQGEGATRVRSPLAPGVYFWRTAWGEYTHGDGKSFARGPWGRARSFRVPPRPRASATNTFWGGFLDVNCDGFGDAAVATQDPRSGRGVVEVFHGSAEGLSASAAWSLPLSTPLHDLSAVGDLNNDGCGELGITAEAMLAIHPGSPEGLGAPRLAIERPPAAPPELRLMLSAGGSVDRNGSELVVHGGGRVWVHGGNPSLSPTPGRTYGGESDPGFETTYGGAADLNGDGYGDLVLIRSKQRQVQQLRLIRGSTLGPWDPDQVLVPSTSGPSSCLGDLDADGLPELLLAGPASAADGKKSGVSIYRDGSPPPKVIALPALPLQQIDIPGDDLRIHCADVNGDGRDDLLVTRHDPGEAGRRLARVGVYLASAEGTLALAQTLREEDYVGGLQTDFAAEVSTSDLDGDGRLELVVTAPATDAERSGLLLIFADAHGDDLGRPTVRTGAAGFAQRLALGFR